MSDLRYIGRKCEDRGSRYVEKCAGWELGVMCLCKFGKWIKRSLLGIVYSNKFPTSDWHYVCDVVCFLV